MQPVTTTILRHNGLKNGCFTSKAFRIGFISGVMGTFGNNRHLPGNDPPPGVYLSALSG
jgi:hypothetical protein